MNNDQEIRARSLEIAVQVKGQGCLLDAYIKLAKEIADYIRGYTVDESKIEVGDCDGLSEDDVSE